MTLPELARELELPDHAVWLAAGPLIRLGGWDAVFARGMHLTEPAEYAIRETVTTLYRIFGGT